MKTILVVTTLLVSSACSVSENKTQAVDVNEQYTKAKQMSVKQAQSAEANEYFGSMASFWEKNLNKSAGKCDVGAGGSVELILEINEQGVIDEVVGSPWNKKSRCYAKVISGQKASPPPEHPFFLSTVLP